MKRVFLYVLATLFFSIFFVNAAFAAPDTNIYGNRVSNADNDPIYLIDPNTGGLTTVANSLFPSAALARSPVSGLLYYTQYNVTDSQVATWNPDTGVHTVIGNLGAGVGALARLAFRANNVLYGVDNSCNLFTINTTTGVATSVGLITGAQCDSGDIAFGADDVMYYVAGGADDTFIWTINLGTLVATQVHDVQTEQSIAGIAFAFAGAPYSVRTLLLHYSPTWVETTIGSFPGGVRLADAASSPIYTDLSLTKIVSDPTPDVGNDVDFEIEVINDGPVNATGVVVTDLLPSGYTYVSDDSGGSYDPITGIWTVGAVVIGSTQKLKITATVLGTGVYDNGAEITAAGQFDPDSTPDNDVLAEDDQVSITVMPVAANVCSIWSLQASGTTEALRGVHFPVGDAIGYAVGNAGTILKTTNGGTNWNPLPSAAQNLNNVYFPVDASTGWVIGNAGLILKTIDGGASWVAQTSNTVDNLNGIHFPVDALTGYVVGRNGVIRKTTDGGANWNILPSAASNLSAVQFPVDAVTGYAVGSSGLIIKTTNGGAGWVAQTSGTTETLSGVNFPIGTLTGWVVGNTGTIRNTTDSGSNWNSQASGTGDNLDDIQFPTNNSTGYLIGKFGRVMDTTSGGDIWTLDTNVPTAQDLRAIHFPLNTSTGYITGNNGTILKCGTGGAGGPSLEVVKRAFWLDGTPIPTGVDISSGVQFRFMLYVSNPGALVADVSMQDVLAAAFNYVGGSIMYDNSVVNCAADPCTAVEEAAIFAAVDSGTVGTDPVNGDVVSYTGSTLDVGDQVQANLQLDILGNRVWAVMFTVTIL